MAEHVTKVFISATSKDLRSVRKLVRDALLNMGCLPVVQEHFPPDYRNVSEMLRERISDCDALIHIAGMRYGAEPDPATLPAGVPRRSYTQMEVDLARELKLEKIFTFVCPENFPYDTTTENGLPLEDEPDELRSLQSAHRERLLSQAELYYQAKSPDELAARVREMQLELAEVKGKLRQARGRMLKVGAALAGALALIVGGVIFTIHQGEQTRDNVEEIRRQFEDNPEMVAGQLREFVRKNAEKEIAAIPGEWARIAEIESARDRQLAEIEDLVSFIRGGLSEVSDPVFVRAAAILADNKPGTGGPANALAYLQASRDRLLKEVDSLAAMEEEARNRKQEKLRAFLLESEIHQQAFEWDEALAGLRLVVEKAPEWWEARDKLGNLCRERALWEEAEQHLQHALAMAGEENRAASQNALAVFYQETGQYDKAEPLYRETLQVSEKDLGRDHLSTLNLMNNLALLLKQKGTYDEAEQLYREALAGKEKVLGRDDLSTLTTMNSLAGLLESKGAYAEAEPLYRETLERRQRLLGPDHPSTLVSMNNLAVLLRATGRFEDAEPLYREALETSRRVLGADHPSTLTAMNNLAGLLQSKGDYETSERLFREALKVGERVAGADHPDTLGTRNNLAVLLQSMGRSDDAEPLFREVLDTSFQVLGPLHPDTLSSMNNLAEVLRTKGNFEEAEPLYRTAVEVEEKILGREHPLTLSSIVNLAGMLDEKGEHQEADTLFREVVDTRRKVLGDDHPDTLTALNNYASMLFARKDYNRAEPIFRQTHEGFQKKFGPEHPSTKVVKKNWDRCRDEMATPKPKVG